MIAVSSRGHNFRALGAYLAGRTHGVDRLSTELTPGGDRVAWRSARHVPTNDPEFAASFMASTAQQNARVQKPVYHLVLTFDPTDPVTRTDMERVATRVLTRLELQDHQAVIVAHQDKAHPHMHLMINRVHPETLKAWDRSWDYRDIQQVLREEERALGWREVPGRLYRLPGQELGEHLETRGERQVRVRGDPLFLDRVRGYAAELRQAKTWHDVEATLGTHGLSLQKQGRGLVVTDGTHTVKASSIARDLSHYQLEKRFGVAYHDRQQDPARIPEDITVPHDVQAVADDIRRYERAQQHISTAYDTELAVAQARQTLDRLGWRVTAAHQAEQHLDAAFHRVYQEPVAARRAYEHVAAERGPTAATAVLRETPEQFGTLLTVERSRAFGLYTEIDTTAARAEARTAAFSAVEAHQARAQAATPADLQDARADLDRLLQRRAALHEAERSLPSLHGRDGQRLTHEIATRWERLSDTGHKQLRRVLSETQFALGRKLVRTAKDLLLDRDPGWER